MEKVKINFSMMIDDLEDTVFESEGLILKDKMHFDDPNHFHYVIEFSNHSVHIDRKGHTIMKLILETDMITNGTLMTEGLTFPFTVRTHHISLTEGLLLVKYDMLDEQTIISRHQLMIKWNQNGRNGKND